MAETKEKKAAATPEERRAAAKEYRDSQKKKKLCYNGSCQNKTDGDGYCDKCNVKINVRRERWAKKHAAELKAAGKGPKPRKKAKGGTKSPPRKAKANGNGHKSAPRAPRAPKDTPPPDRTDVTPASQEAAPAGDTGAA